jgi:hypothetical protein
MEAIRVMLQSHPVEVDRNSGIPLHMSAQWELDLQYRPWKLV